MGGVMADTSTSSEIIAPLLKFRKSAKGGAKTQPSLPAASEAEAMSLLILSDIRFLRDGLVDILTREHAFQIFVAATLAEAFEATRVALPDMILIDTTLPDGRVAVTRLRELAPEVCLVALAVTEIDAEIIAWAEAGVSGYLPRSAALSDLVGYLNAIMHGEQACSTQVAGGLLRWIAFGRHTGGPRPGAAPPPLTAREEEVVGLIGAGYSNKEIARRLSIGLATTKSHVHNLLGKLRLKRRIQVARWSRVHRNP